MENQMTKDKTREAFEHAYRDAFAREPSSKERDVYAYWGYQTAYAEQQTNKAIEAWEEFKALNKTRLAASEGGANDRQ